MSEIVINGVSVTSIADYAKRRHLKVSFVQNHLIKGDDQNDPIEPVHKLNRTGMYSIDELDAAYLTRGSKGITLASMGYLHPAKAAEMESRIRELIQEKEFLARDAVEAAENLNDSETELESVKSQLFRAQQLLDSGQKAYDSLMAEYNIIVKDRDEMSETLDRIESGHHN